MLVVAVSPPRHVKPGFEDHGRVTIYRISGDSQPEPKTVDRLLGLREPAQLFRCRATADFASTIHDDDSHRLA